MIRRAVLADLPLLQLFAVQTWEVAFAHTFTDPAEPERYIAEELSSARFAQAFAQDAILLALNSANDELLGYIQIGPAQFDDLETLPGDQDLRRLYVAAAEQGQGIGQQLLEAALSLDSVRQAANLYLDVWERNTRAQKFYRRFGFSVIAHRRYISASGQPEDVDFQMRRRQSQ